MGGITRLMDAGLHAKPKTVQYAPGRLLRWYRLDDY